MLKFPTFYRYYLRGDDVEEQEDKIIDELSVHRWLKEAKTDFKAYQERLRETGDKQDRFDLLLKYLEVAAAQAKKNSFKQDTS
jgi:hypothetical protein